MKKPQKVILVLSLFMAGSLQAANGLYMIGYGARSAGMGGAGLALGGSAMDLESNPALLGDAGVAQLEAGFRYNYSEISYQDQYQDSDPTLAYSNRRETALNAFMPYAGYSRSVRKNLGVGIALYLQGGGGGEFKGIRRNTPRANSLNEYLGYDLGEYGQGKQLQEGIFARMMNARLTPGFGLRLGRAKIGLAVDGVFGRVEMRNTYYDPSGRARLPGTGLAYKSDPAYGVGGKLGFTYDLNARWTLALAYTTPVKLHLDGGMQVNTGNPEYYRKTGVSLEQIWPAVYRAGVAYRRGALKVAFDVDHIKWSGAMNAFDFKLEDPYIQTPLGTTSARLSMNHDWRDQTVLALGVEYKPGQLTYRAGYNYGRTPVTGVGINPLFATTTEHHMTAGVGLELGSLGLDMALEYDLPHRVEGANNSNWDLAHAVQGPDRIRTPLFEHSKTQQLISINFGVRYRFENRANGPYTKNEINKPITTGDKT